MQEYTCLKWFLEKSAPSISDAWFKKLRILSVKDEAIFDAEDCSKLFNPNFCSRIWSKSNGDTSNHFSSSTGLRSVISFFSWFSSSLVVPSNIVLILWLIDGDDKYSSTFDK